MRKSASLKSRTVKSFFWRGSGQIAKQIIGYLFLTILAWQLTPRDFGLVGLSMIFINVATKVGELGVNASLIQEKKLTNETISTGFWLNLGVSIVLYLTTLYSKGLIAEFLNEPEVESLIIYLSILFPIYALTVTPSALLQRELKFNKIAQVDVISEVVFGVVGLSLVILNFGIWSLVWATISRAMTRLILLWLASPTLPSFLFTIPAAKNLISFGLPVMISALLARLVANADYFVVGRFLGAEMLGFYTLAFQLIVLPLQQFVNILRDVLFPSFSKLQKQLSSLQNAYLSALEIILISFLPLGLLIIMFFPPITAFIYGEKWSETAALIPVLTLAGLAYGADVSESVMFALKRPTIRIFIVGLRLLLFLGLGFTALYFGFGTWGIAWSTSISVLTSSLLGIITTFYLLKVSRSLILELAQRTAVFLLIFSFILLSYLYMEARSSLNIFLIGLNGSLFILYLLFVIKRFEFKLLSLLKRLKIAS